MKHITEPTLLLNEQICKSNIQRMADKARKHNLAFKPHMKTHQSAEIGRWLAEAGGEAITVSSVKMARYFADHDWDDITIAFPCNILKMDELNQLASEVELTVLVNKIETARALENGVSNSVKAYIELDTGSQRTGLGVDQIAEIEKLIEQLNSADNIEWIGFYSHPGHSYRARSRAEIEQIHNAVIEQFQDLRANLSSSAGDFEICMGDTPCCSVGTNFEGINAISPGNFVFYDLMQYQIGSCNIEDIAVAVECPIVDKFAGRNELAIHGGAIHFSKERMEKNGLIHFGKAATTQENHWEIEDDAPYLKALSQEHGIVKCSDRLIDKYNIGDLITILPVHSCLTANLMKTYYLEGRKQIVQL